MKPSVMPRADRAPHPRQSDIDKDRDAAVFDVISHHYQQLPFEAKRPHAATGSLALPESPQPWFQASTHL
eukprot:scaffold38579_cov38-Tisochrysis_lutea.AAC.2